MEAPGGGDIPKLERGVLTPGERARAEVACRWAVDCGTAAWDVVGPAEVWIGSVVWFDWVEEGFVMARAAVEGVAVCEWEVVVVVKVDVLRPVEPGDEGPVEDEALKVGFERARKADRKLAKKGRFVGAGILRYRDEE